MAKEKTTNKQTAKKVDWERAHHIAELLGIYAQFFPRVDDPSIPLLSKEFVFKNLLGLTNEEYELNETLLYNETNNILESLKKTKAALEAADNAIEEVCVAKTKKSKKQKVN